MCLYELWARRFWSKVIISPGCWNWSGSTTSLGYGYFSEHRTGKKLLAHRVSWEIKNGPIPGGMQIDHLCRNRACVNPDHLEVVNGRINILRGTSPSAKNALKTECPSGHPYSATNTYTDKKGKRHCRECGLSRWHERRKRQEADNG